LDRLSRFSLFDPETQENPYEYYRILRQDAPVYKLPEGNYYIVSRYADVREALRRPDIFSSDFDNRSLSPLGQPPEVGEIFAREGWVRKRVLKSDAPAHTMYRKLVDQAFTPRRVRAMEPYIEALVADLIDGWIADGEVEFVGRFANALPMIVICDRLGVPRGHAERFKRWSDASVDSLSPSTPAERQVECAHEMIEMRRYFLPLFEARRGDPRGDILSDIVNARLDDGRMLDTPEMLDLVEQLLTGGNETTAHAVGSGMLLLIENPAVLVALGEQPDLLKTFIEEVLRLESPTQGTFRIVSEETTLGGTALPKGALVNLRYGAVNRDARQFPNPDEIDLGRDIAGSHMAFISGVHHCLGAPLARQEMICSFRDLLARAENFRLTPGMPAPKHLHNFMMRGLQHLYISFDPR
jgi:cytochrome P450